MKAAVLERYCVSILTESAALCADTERSSHERYLALNALINKRNRAVAQAFDGHSRSRTRFQLRVMLETGLLTEEEQQRFGLEDL